jgi:hypothetical protein
MGQQKDAMRPYYEGGLKRILAWEEFGDQK